MPPTPKLEWVRPPLQERSQKSLERILDAAEEVIGELGFERATVAEIVRRAQSSVGVFYARFRDKDALLSCLHDRFCERAMATTDAVLHPDRWNGCSIEKILESTVPFLVTSFKENAGLFRAFLIRSSQDEEFAAGALRLHDHMSERLRTLMLARRAEIGHPEPAKAVDFGMRILLDELDHRTFFREDERPISGVLSEKELVTELVRVFVGYLQVARAPARPRRRPVGAGS